MDKNKVQFNLKNVHYAVITENEGDVSFAAPVHVPGAVTLSLEPQGEVTPFYADGITYYQSVSNNGYAGDLEMAKYPDQMMIDIWCMEELTEDHVLIEKANVEPKSFALLFQIDGDRDNELYVMYNCVGTRPAISSKTNTETKEPQTQTSSITAAPLENGNVMARTTSQTPQEVKVGWFKKVYEPKTSEETA